MTEVDIIKLATLAYWRYDRQHIAGAIECSDSDVITISKGLMLADSEIKISIADMRREISTKRYKHGRMSGVFGAYPSVNYFYFVVPERLKDKALDVARELYPYAGLLICRDNIENIYGHIGQPANVYSVKPAKRLQRPKPDIKEITRIAYAASNTAIRYGDKLFATNSATMEVKDE